MKFNFEFRKHGVRNQCMADCKMEKCATGRNE